MRQPHTAGDHAISTRGRCGEAATGRRIAPIWHEGLRVLRGELALEPMW